MADQADIRRGRLFEAVKSCYRVMGPFRNMNANLVDMHAGDGYGAGKKHGKRETVVNLINQTVNAYMLALAANRPRVLISTRNDKLLSFAAHYQIAMNNLLTEIGIAHTIRRWVMDAFFCIGIVKVHMASQGTVQLETDLWADPGQPFASNVSLDNFVCDMRAHKWTEMQFAGDVYRIPFEDLQDETLWPNQDMARKLRPTSRAQLDDSRLERIALGYETDPDEYIPMVDMLDLWVPREHAIETYACEFRGGELTPFGEPLAVLPWTGTEFGPYKKLGFDEVPENIMPASPASHLTNLALRINAAYRKQMRSANDFKEVTTYTAAGEKSARNVLAAKHGALVQINDPSEVGQLRLGGVDQEQQMYLLNMLDHYDKAAGNITAMLGLGPQAETAKQEQLIHGTVSGRTGQMAQLVGEAVESLARDLGHLLWDDEHRVIPGTIRIPGLEEYALDATWRPGDREGRESDYELTVDVHSMSYKSPQQRGGALLQLLTQVYAPLAPMLASQGGVIDFRQLTDILSDLMDMPRLRQIVKFVGVAQEQQQGTAGEGPGKPAATSREYIRRSSAGSPASQSVMQQQAWAAAAARNPGVQTAGG